MRAILKNALVLAGLSILATSCESDINQKSMEDSYQCLNDYTRTCISNKQYISCENMVPRRLTCQGTDVCKTINGVGKCVSPNGSKCGNGKIDDGEECDEHLLNDKTCSDVDPQTVGDLSCKSDCHFDTSECKPKPVCGNGKIEDNEYCDGEVTDVSCDALDMKGKVTCNKDCTLNYSECHKCGDGIINEGEECDGDNINNKTCNDLIPGSSGDVTCDSDCTLSSKYCFKRPDELPAKCEKNLDSIFGGLFCASDGNLWQCDSKGEWIVFMDCANRNNRKCFICGNEQRIGCYHPDETDVKGACESYSANKCNEDTCAGNSLAFCVDGSYNYSVCHDNGICVKCDDGKIGCISPTEDKNTFCK